jgi:hypothetical protein
LLKDRQVQQSDKTHSAWNRKNRTEPEPEKTGKKPSQNREKRENRAKSKKPSQTGLNQFLF